jgi:hypothetical protein
VDIQVASVNQMSWSAIGTRPAERNDPSRS